MHRNQIMEASNRANVVIVVGAIVDVAGATVVVVVVGRGDHSCCLSSPQLALEALSQR